MIIAIIEDSKVVNTVEAQNIEDAALREGQIAIDLTERDPQPGIDWSYDLATDSFAAPLPPEPSSPVLSPLMTHRYFMKRVPDEMFDSILDAEATDKTLRRAMFQFKLAQNVDVRLQEVIDFVNYMAYMEYITPAVVGELLAWGIVGEDGVYELG